MAQKQNSNGRRNDPPRRKKNVKHRRGVTPRRISVTSLNPVAGIDIASTRFDLCVILPNEGSNHEIVLDKIARNFMQNERGFQSCVNILRKNEVTRVALESTGIYHEPLQYYLIEAGFQVFVVNPSHVNPKGRNVSKRDKLDAFKLAEKLFYGSIGEKSDYKPSYIPTDEVEIAIKRLTRVDLQTKSERTRVINRIHKLFRRRGLQETSLGRKKNLPYQLVLEAVASQENPEVFFERINEDKTLHYNTRNSLENRRAEITTFLNKTLEVFNRADRSILRRHFEVYRICTDSINNTNEQLHNLLPQTSPAIQRLVEIAMSITPGMSKDLALRVVIEFGNPNRFTNRRAIGSYTGLEPVIRMSGGKGSIRGISKSGNSYLRRHLFIVADRARRYNKQYAAFYTRLRKKNRTHNQAVCAIARKIGVAYVLRAKDDEKYRKIINEEQSTDDQ